MQNYQKGIISRLIHQLTSQINYLFLINLDQFVKVISKTAEKD